MTTPVTFWFDVACPFAWMTSQWMREVCTVRDVDLEFRPMSLAVLNDGRDIPADYAKKMEANWGPARVFAKVAQDRPDAVGDLYQAMGWMLHQEGEGGKDGYGAYDDVIAKALAQVGLDASFADVANTDEMDAALRAMHQEAMDAVGEDSGTPIVRIGDAAAFFGPVITRRPSGEEAGTMFDAVAHLASVPSFFSVNRARTEMPQTDSLS